MQEAGDHQLEHEEEQFDAPPPDLPMPQDMEAAPSDEHDDEFPSAGLPDKPVVQPDAQLIALDQIHELDNSRSELGEVGSLAENIRVRGLLHPVVVRPAADPSHGLKYELVVGYRRKAAFEALEREEIPAIVHAATDEEVLAELLSENFERENPAPLDEARTMKRMIDLFGWSHRQVAAHLGLSKSQVTKRLGLLKLPEKVQVMMGEGKITASHAEVIARLDNPDSQEELAELAVKKNAPVEKLNGYASKIKERDDERLEADDPEAKEDDAAQPLDSLTVEDVVPITRLIVKDDLDSDDFARAQLYMLLRSANDQEMLDTLQEQYGVAFAHLWEWVEALDDQQVSELIETMLRRWLAAAHRYPTFPESLKQRYGAGESDLTNPDLLALPDGVAPPEDDDDFDWENIFDEEDGDEENVF